MPTTDERIDAYIEKSAEFAQPILQHLRRLVHTAIPEITETIKWGMPHFEYHGIICHLAAFKQHCSLGFWNAPEMSDPHQLLNAHGKTEMGHFGKIKNLADLPDDSILLKYFKEAATLRKNNIKPKAKPKASVPKDVVVPAYFQEALNQNDAARQTFEQFSPSNRKDYLVWLSEAKTEATHDKRLATILEWLAEGKTRHWKYQKK